uniref:Uncharacterized protein n=1 Tax=Arundo donax TaxID=35708 RepID=A0A0A9F675_ARUDO
MGHYARHAPQPALAFVAPPSSPASSVLTSESPSPVVLLNASSYSSPTASMFAIGPYAREAQQLVSPPAFSAGLTEPSTAPLTPPPESTCSLHLGTTPSSPEVPFARFLLSSVAAEAEQQCREREGRFHAYQLQPGSPIGVSPGSTSSSPPAWMLGAEEMASREQRRVRARNEGSLLDGGGIPEAEGGAVSSEASTGSARNNDEEEVPKSGEFVFGSGDGGGGSTEEEGRKHQQWPFFLPVPDG